MNKIAVVIADDHPIIRRAIRKALRNNDALEFLEDANDGLELMALVKNIVPDIAIIDLGMPRMDGYETIQTLHSQYPEVKIIAFSGFLTQTNQKRAIEMGASATICKTESFQKLIMAFETVINGGTYHSDVGFDISSISLEGKKNMALTLREQQILTLITQGKTSMQISMEYNISKWTVDKHRANIKDKLGLNNLAEMVRYAIENGYFTQT